MGCSVDDICNSTSEEEEEDNSSWEIETDELIELILNDSHFEDICKFIKENAPLNRSGL